MKKIIIKDKKKMLTTTSILITIILIIALITAINIRRNINQTTQTDGQAIEETNIEDNKEETVENEILEETEPLDENVIDENAIKESKVTNENQVKESTNKYYVKVNNQANVVTIYTKDSEGNYTVPVKAMICSIGTSTPTGGKYKLNGTKHRWHTLFGHTPGTYVYGQYTTAIVGNILFHSVPYTTKGDPSSLEYLEYDKLGTKASAGCIRLTVQDAAWIYNNITTGTIVEFYYDSNPGPLGKPGAAKISGNTVCRGWDPTDSNPNNPWRNNNNNKSTDTTQNSQQSKDTNQNQEQNSKTNNNTEQNKDQNQQANQEETKANDGNKKEENNNSNQNNTETNTTENKTSNEIKNNLSNNINGNTTNVIKNTITNNIIANNKNNSKTNITN